jgi:hypothetical protein
MDWYGIAIGAAILVLGFFQIAGYGQAKVEPKRLRTARWIGVAAVFLGAGIVIAELVTA